MGGFAVWIGLTAYASQTTSEAVIPVICFVSSLHSVGSSDVFCFKPAKHSQRFFHSLKPAGVIPIIPPGQVSPVSRKHSTPLSSTYRIVPSAVSPILSYSLPAL